MLHTETVTADTLALIKRLMTNNELSDFTLVGGTALALHIGHRTSIDIDLFSIKSFDTEKTGKFLSEKYEAQDMQILKNEIFCFIVYNTEPLTTLIRELRLCHLGLN